MKVYYREPSVVIFKPDDYTAAFTMRLLNFLYRLGLKSQKTINPQQVDYYAKRMAVSDPRIMHGKN